jgi:hypothetical protein
MRKTQRIMRNMRKIARKRRVDVYIKRGVQRGRTARTSTHPKPRENKVPLSTNMQVQSLISANLDDVEMKPLSSIKDAAPTAWQ